MVPHVHMASEELGTLSQVCPARAHVSTQISDGLFIENLQPGHLLRALVLPLPSDSVSVSLQASWCWGSVWGLLVQETLPDGKPTAA